MNEEFEREWKKTNEPLVEMGIHEDSEYNKNMAKYYYLAGAAAMREKCAEVANSMAIDCPSDKCPEYTDMDDCMYKETGFCIAAAIRQMEVT